RRGGLAQQPRRRFVDLANDAVQIEQAVADGGEREELEVPIPVGDERDAARPIDRARAIDQCGGNFGTLTGPRTAARVAGVGPRGVPCRPPAGVESPGFALHDAAPAAIESCATVAPRRVRRSPTRPPAWLRRGGSRFGRRRMPN